MAYLLRIFNLIMCFKQTVFSFICMFISYLYYHWEYDFAKFFSYFVIEMSQMYKANKKFHMFSKFPASAHSFQHNPASSQTTLVKTTKGYAYSRKQSKGSPTPTPINRNVRHILIIPGGFQSREQGGYVLTYLAIIGKILKSQLWRIQEKKVIANAR